jgi:LmbE family N-acetylglucosaminyl deacetylase
MTAVVAVVAHPDDESLIAGGTLALAARAGAVVGVVSLTRGEQGPIAAPELATPETLGDVREAELRAAGEVLGASFTGCLRHPDGELEWSDHERVADELATLMAPHEPAAVLTFGADGLYGHSDHVATRQITGLALDRLEAAGASEVCLYESVWPPDLVTGLVEAARQSGLATDLWGLEPATFGSPGAVATLVVDARSVLDHKLRALRAHRSQLDSDHLLAALSDDLAARFLRRERWRLARPSRGDGGPLVALLGEWASVAAAPGLGAGG